MMKKVQILLAGLIVSLFVYTSCGEDPAAAGMSCEIDGNEWKADEGTVKCTIWDYYFTLEGKQGSKTIKLIVNDSLKWGTNYLLNGSKIEYDGGSVIKTFIGSGEIYIDKLSYENDEVEGTFYAELEGDMSITKGVFKNVIFADSSHHDPVDPVGPEPKKKSTIKAIIDRDGKVISNWKYVDSCFFIEGGFITGGGFFQESDEIDSSTITIRFPATVQAGESYDLVQDNPNGEFYFSYTYKDLSGIEIVYDNIVSGRLIVNTYDKSLQKIEASFLFEATTDDGTKSVNVYNGALTIFYYNY